MGSSRPTACFTSFNILLRNDTPVVFFLGKAISCAGRALSPFLLACAFAYIFTADSGGVQDGVGQWPTSNAERSRPMFCYQRPCFRAAPALSGVETDTLEFSRLAKFMGLDPVLLISLPKVRSQFRYTLSDYTQMNTKRCFLTVMSSMTISSRHKGLHVYNSTCHSRPANPRSKILSRRGICAIPRRLLAMYDDRHPPFILSRSASEAGCGCPHGARLGASPCGCWVVRALLHG